MWLFRRKKKDTEAGSPGVPCSFCGSSSTRLITHHGTGKTGYVKTWRGQRSLTYRCLRCGRDFYGPEPPEGIENRIQADDSLVDDEDALRAAEEELNRQIEEDDDRTCR
jgi:hypothetical protein